MPTIAGSLIEVSLAGRSFAVDAESDSSRKQGGFENEIKPNGNGTARLIKTRVAWMTSDINVEIDDLRGDADFLQKLQNRLSTFPCSVTYVSGATFSGDGQIVGEVSTSSQSGTATLALSGSLEFLVQS